MNLMYHRRAFGPTEPMVSWLDEDTDVLSPPWRRVERWFPATTLAVVLLAGVGALLL